MKVEEQVRVVVVYNRDFEGAEADPENKAREDVADIAGRIVDVLASRGLDAEGLGVADDVLGAMAALRSLAPDVVFNLCESIRGDNRFEPLLPLLLELEGIAFSGSGPLALALALHKEKAKDVLRARGIPTPEFVLAETAGAGVDLPFPLIVKPSREDASVGICSASVVRDRAALDARVRHVLDHYRQPALVERYVEGREIYVSLLGRPGERLQVFPFFEIDFSDLPADLPRIVSFEGKWVEGSVEYRGTRPVRCRGLAPALEDRIAEVAVAVFEAFGLRDYARMDVRLAPEGVPYVIDVNPNCDLSDLAGGFSKAAKAAGLGYEDVILRIVELALARRSHADTIPFTPRSRAVERPPQAGKPFSSGRGDLRARAPRGGARTG